MNEFIVEADFCVIGGGVAGICAALAASREGLRVVLVQNRSLLGGNASSEIRQAIGGAGFMGHFPDAREGGIVGDLWTRVRQGCFRNNLNDYAESSVIFWDLCQKEKNLQLFLNTHVTAVEKKGSRLISITGIQTSTGRTIVVRAAQFADCSGDANVAYLAGAAFMSGQEGRDEFGESLAPHERTSFTMGNTLLFQAEKLDRPVPPPHFDWIEDLRGRKIWWTLHPPVGPMESGCWTFEYGGTLDTVADAEKIYAELLKILYSAWSDLKLRPECGMENYRISFVSGLPGKRESRRVIGDYILSQNDIVSMRRFSDDVAYAGWSLDLHHPEGFYGPGRPTQFCFFPEIHSLPLRCLYARDLDNLWLAGRDISVTHIALGGVRLMATCGLAGEAIGTAATYFAQAGSCRETGRRFIKEIQQTILRGGGFIPEVRNNDSSDLARHAIVSAHSEAVLETGEPTEWVAISNGIGIAFPVTAQRLGTLTLWTRNATAAPATLRAVLQPIRALRDFHSTKPLAQARSEAPPGEAQIVFTFNAVGLRDDVYMVHVFSDSRELCLGQVRRRITGVHAADHFPDGNENGWAIELGTPNPPHWVRRFNNQRNNAPEEFHSTPCFTLQPPSCCYSAANVINGFNRPTRLPNLWASDPRALFPQELILRWPEPVCLKEIRIVFDDDMDLSMPPLVPLSTLVADYTLEAETDAGPLVLASVKNNGHRLAIHSISGVSTQLLRLRIERMHAGGTQARVFEIRCYGQGPCIAPASS